MRFFAISSQLLMCSLSVYPPWLVEGYRWFYKHLLGFTVIVAPNTASFSLLKQRSSDDLLLQAYQQFEDDAEHNQLHPTETAPPATMLLAEDELLLQASPHK